MKPTVKIVSGLDGIVADDISGEGIMVGIPSVNVIIVGWNWQTVGAELIAYDTGDDTLGVEPTETPFKLTVRIATIILALVPISNRNRDCVRITEGGSFPTGRDTVFVLDIFERHGANKRRDCDDS